MKIVEELAEREEQDRGRQPAERALALLGLPDDLDEPLHPSVLLPRKSGWSATRADTGARRRTRLMSIPSDNGTARRRRSSPTVWKGRSLVPSWSSEPWYGST